MNRKYIQIENRIFDENEIIYVDFEQVSDAGADGVVMIALSSGFAFQIFGEKAVEYWEIWQSKMNSNLNATR